VVDGAVTDLVPVKRALAPTPSGLVELHVRASFARRAWGGTNWFAARSRLRRLRLDGVQLKAVPRRGGWKPALTVATAVGPSERRRALTASR